MANFVICLEIREHTRDYGRLRQLLGKMNAAQAQDSVWFVSVNGRAEQLRDALKTVTHSGDSIIVARLQDNGASDWAEFYHPKEGVEWLKTHFR